MPRRKVRENARTGSVAQSAERALTTSSMFVYMFRQMLFIFSDNISNICERYYELTF